MTNRFYTAIRIFIFLMCAAYTLPSSATVPTQYTVVRMLQTQGMINWVPYAGNSQERAALFNVLIGIVKDPTGLNDTIRNRALIESGKFADADDGSMRTDAISFYDGLGTPDDNASNINLHYALIQSLEMSNSPESLELLAKATQSSDTKIAEFAVDTIAKIASTDQNIPPWPESDEYRFEPTYGVLLANRKNPSAWAEKAETASRTLDQLKLAPSKVSEYAERIDHARHQIGALLKQAKKVSSGEEESALNQGKEINGGADHDSASSRSAVAIQGATDTQASRSPASTQTENTLSRSSRRDFAWLALLISIAFAWVVFRKRKT